MEHLIGNRYAGNRCAGYCYKRPRQSDRIQQPDQMEPVKMVVLAGEITRLANNQGGIAWLTAMYLVMRYPTINSGGEGADVFCNRLDDEIDL